MSNIVGALREPPKYMERLGVAEWSKQPKGAV